MKNFTLAWREGGFCSHMFRSTSTLHSCTAVSSRQQVVPASLIITCSRLGHTQWCPGRKQTSRKNRTAGSCEALQQMNQPRDSFSAGIIKTIHFHCHRTINLCSTDNKLSLSPVWTDACTTHMQAHCLCCVYSLVPSNHVILLIRHLELCLHQLWN